MKFIRFLLGCLILAAVLIAILLAAAFSPPVQTWVAQRALAGRPGLKGSLGSLSAGLSEIDLEDLHLEMNGCVLTAPSLQAELPIMTAIRDRKIRVRSLVAKGWTLEISRQSEPENGEPEVVQAGSGATPGAQDEADAVQKVPQIFRGILSGRKLPVDASLDGVDLEGDVLVPGATGKPSSRIHVRVKGGGIAAGREGNFAIDAATAIANPGLSADVVTSHGSLVVAMDSQRAVNRAELRASFSGNGRLFPEDLVLSAGVETVRDAGQETYTLELSRGSRHLATIFARLSEATGLLAGTWKVGLQDSDLALLAQDPPQPVLALDGEGRFDSSPDFARLHVVGRLGAVASRLGLLASPFERLGKVALEIRFDLAHDGQSIAVDQFSISLGGAGQVARFRSLQSFTLDEKTWALKTADPAGDWMEGMIQGIPLSWFSGLTGGSTLSGSDVTGELLMRSANGRYALRSKTPLTASGVTVQKAGRILAQGLDLALSLKADCTSQGWQVQLTPFSISRSGQRFATLDAKATRPAGADSQIAIIGKWNADLDSLTATPNSPEIAPIKGRSVSGDFSGSVGPRTELDGNLLVVGHDPGNSVTASAHATIDADGSGYFLAPVKIVFGSGASEMAAEGTWTKEASGASFDAKLTGENVSFDHFRRLAATGGFPLPTSSAIASAEARPAAGMRDRIPFWDGWAGRVRIAFDKMKVGSTEFDNVRGAFDIDPASIRLSGGQGGLPNRRTEEAEGSISFDAAAKLPYALKTTITVDKIDAASLFPAPKFGEDPLIEGHFSVARTLTGNGLNWNDLLGRTQEKFRLTGTNGIMRLLKTSVAESVPEVATPVKDALGTVGSVMGSIFRIKGNAGGSGKNPVSTQAEALLAFTNEISEIGYDKLSITAVRDPDGAIRIAELAMNSEEVHLAGTGRIDDARGLPLSARPLSAELHLGLRGAIAGLLSTSGLLSSKKDDASYSLLNEPIHLGGTLEHIDESQWHDLLAAAATRKPDQGK